MNIQNDCVACIVGQIDKALDLLDVPQALADEIKQEVKEYSKSFSFSYTPPFIAKDVYAYLASRLNLSDPLETIKQQSIEKATELLPYIYKMIDKSDDKLFASIKASVAGNVIDFGAKEQFCLTNEVLSIFEKDFAINHYDILSQQILKADTILVLGDNSGENVFDKVLLQTIKNLYPSKELFYATRGKPIINDITTKEAYQVGIDAYATIVDSGVDTPGLDLSRASDEFKKLFFEIPLIIAKGMGNYECLEQLCDERIFFLFKVKCNVVASSIDKEIGDIVLLQK
ncbi:MAG: ARMT1-like domain-containing protein [Arcobacteraceae bacterium]|nr:ARMT1-like domain-containing protein [Arcobacteraceae bacterium]